MNPILVIIGLLGGLVAGYLYVTFKAKPKSVSRAEYWVYLPETEIPTQNDLMAHLVGPNPYTQRGRNPIGPAEGLVLSDIRLSISQVLRSKNPRMFDPTVALVDIPNSPDEVAAILNAKTVVRLRFISEESLPDKRHLQFLIHAADAYMRIGRGSLVLDLTARLLWTPETLANALRANFDATVPALQIRQDLREDESSLVMSTTGFAKIGLMDFETYPMPTDYRVLAASLFESIVEKVWSGQQLEEVEGLEAFGDQFKITVEPDSKSKKQFVRIHRVHGAQ